MKHTVEATLLTALAFLTPIESAIFAAMFLVSVDTFTGVWRAIKQGRRITSYKFGNAIAKFILYSLAIVTASVMQQFLTPLIPTVSLISTAISAREGLSIFENISIVTGTDLVSFLIDKLNPRKEQNKHDDDESTRP